MNFALKTRDTETSRISGEQPPINADRPSIVMCEPRHFAVDYVINPWMEHQIGRTEGHAAWAQWENLRQGLAAHSDLSFIPAAPGLPDMVFTANAGLALNGVVVVSRFQAEQRRPEEKHFRQWFESRGFEIAPWPHQVPFEGAGDALYDRSRQIIWLGHGWRSSAHAAPILENILDLRTVGLKLMDPRFYHLDTCFCPLPGGWLMYYPAAFDQSSLATIEAIVPAGRRLPLGESDALSFACNAVEVRGRVYMNGCSAELRSRLTAAGFTPVITPLSEFLRAGGAAKCLTLTLERHEEM